MTSNDKITCKDMVFLVGYYTLHNDISINFQMICFDNWVGDPTMLDEMRSVAPRITTYDDLKREISRPGGRLFEG